MTCNYAGHRDSLTVECPRKLIWCPILFRLVNGETCRKCQTPRVYASDTKPLVKKEREND